MNSIRVAGVTKESIVDGPGFRYVIFTQGCPHKCVGCHNPETHSRFGGRDITFKEIISDISKNPLLDGVTFSGGEPFLQATKLSILAKEIKSHGLNIMTYTGYTFEELYRNSSKENGFLELLNCTDYLVDGKFEVEKKDMLLKFRGSNNQRIIDVYSSLFENQLILANV